MNNKNHTEKDTWRQKNIYRFEGKKILDAKIIACQYVQSGFGEAVKYTIQDVSKDITLEKIEFCYYEKLPELEVCEHDMLFKARGQAPTPG